jgi:class 3 adenylate cyclase
VTRDEAEQLFREHSDADGGFEEKHVFCALYRVGLLGYVYNDRVRGGPVERFLRPGEATLEPDGVLPRATHYLLHPVLSDVIGRMNPDYLQRIDRVNIVGYGRPWRELAGASAAVPVQMLCVLKADVHGFGTRMRAGTDAPVRHALEVVVNRWAQGAVHAETGSGDSVLIVHEDPVALAQAARHIMDDVYQVPGQPRLRIALHYGEVRTRPSGADAPAIVTGGDAILCAARVEPLVRPGQIWATEEFRQHLALRPSLWRAIPEPGPAGADHFNIKKEGGAEPDFLVRLYRLEL